MLLRKDFPAESQWWVSSLNVWLMAPSVGQAGYDSGSPSICCCLCALPHGWADELSSHNLTVLENKIKLSCDHSEMRSSFNSIIRQI